MFMKSFVGAALSRFFHQHPASVDKEDIGIFSLENPCRDLAPEHAVDGIGIPSVEERHHIFHNRCQKHGHDWQIRGYANSVGPYNWLHWEIGSYHACSHCWARKFVRLESQEQLDTVLKLERDRWAKQWARQSAA